MLNLEIDDETIRKALIGLDYLTNLNKFKDIFGEKEFKERLYISTCRTGDLIFYKEDEPEMYFNNYLNYNETTFEFLNIIFDKIDETYIYYCSYEEMLNGIDKEDKSAIELKDILINGFLLNKEKIDKILVNQVCIYTFYSEIISKTIKKILKENKDLKAILEGYIQSAFDPVIMLEQDPYIIIYELNDNFFILELSDPLAIYDIQDNINIFYKLFKFCKDILEDKGSDIKCLSQ